MHHFNNDPKRLRDSLEIVLQLEQQSECQRICFDSELCISGQSSTALKMQLSVSIQSVFSD